MCECRSCMNEKYDSSVGYTWCDRADDMTEEEYDKYFGDQIKGCPYYRQAIDEYEYGRQLGVFA